MKLEWEKWKYAQHAHTACTPAMTINLPVGKYQPKCLMGGNHAFVAATQPGTPHASPGHCQPSVCAVLALRGEPHGGTIGPASATGLVIGAGSMPCQANLMQRKRSRMSCVTFATTQTSAIQSSTSTLQGSGMNMPLSSHVHGTTGCRAFMLHKVTAVYSACDARSTCMRMQRMQ